MFFYGIYCNEQEIFQNLITIILFINKNQNIVRNINVKISMNQFMKSIYFTKNRTFIK